MRFSRTASKSNHLLLDITAMVDVVFLLIIFFMTTAQFARTTRADVELPKERGEQKNQPEEAGLVVNLLRDGTIIVNQNEMTMDELESMVRNQLRAEPNSDPTRFKLMVRADRNADTAALNDLLRMLEQLGVGTAKLATEIPGRPGGR